MDPDNRVAINMDGVSVWLDVPLEELVARLPADGRRPLAADRAQMERLFAVRQAAYANAQLRVDARGAPSGGGRRAHNRSGQLNDSRPCALPDSVRHPRQHRRARGRARCGPAETWDRVLVLGDLVGYGAEPNGGHRSRAGARPLAMIRGNHDKAACGIEDGSSFNHVARLAAQWTFETLVTRPPRLPARAARRGR